MIVALGSRVFGLPKQDNDGSLLRVLHVLVSKRGDNNIYMKVKCINHFEG